MAHPQPRFGWIWVVLNEAMHLEAESTNSFTIVGRVRPDPGTDTRPKGHRTLSEPGPLNSRVIPSLEAQISA